MPNTSPDLRPTVCVICGASLSVTEIYPATFSIRNLSGADFSARKEHERTHYRIVRCETCGLLRSDPILPENLITGLYEEAGFGYLDETKNLGRTYYRYFQKLITNLPKEAKILEIGCANGFFLQELWDHGFENLKGYEPSIEALAKASPKIKKLIVPQIFRAGLEAENSFDVIASFHTIDHLLNPAKFLQECLRLLKPGAYVYNITHNVDSLVHRLFGERSPAFDIQHIYIFSVKTLTKLLAKLGFTKIQAIPIANTFSVAYLAYMSPLPKFVKNLFAFAKIPLTLRVGNMAVVASKPDNL